ILIDVDWDSFVMLPDIFNDINSSSLSDNEDNDIIINKNLYPSLSNYNDSVNFNTNLLSLAKYSNNHLSFSICERGFGYQTFRNDKDPNDPTIIHRKSFYCLSSSIYKSRKIIDQNSYRIKCTTLESKHTYELNPAKISDVIVRYRHFSDDMIQDIETDSVLFLDTLFEKMFQDLYIRHFGAERRLSGVFWMSLSQQELYQRFSDVVLNDNTSNALVENKLSLTYIWILQYLAKATNNVVSKSFWTDSKPGLINAVSQ
ncbi:6737_t:CDS:2, partial [Racocetra persica]